MEKTKTIKKDDSNEIPDQFDKLCEKYRIVKIDLEKIKKLESKLKSAIVNYTINNELEKGDYHGVNINYRGTFLEEQTIELARQNGINVPMLIKPQEIIPETQVLDRKTLAKLLKKAKLDEVKEYTVTVGLTK